MKCHALTPRFEIKLQSSFRTEVKGLQVVREREEWLADILGMSQVRNLVHKSYSMYSLPWRTNVLFFGAAVRIGTQLPLKAHSVICGP